MVFSTLHSLQNDFAEFSFIFIRDTENCVDLIALQFFVQFFKARKEKLIQHQTMQEKIEHYGLKKMCSLVHDEGHEEKQSNKLYLRHLSLRLGNFDFREQSTLPSVKNSITMLHISRVKDYFGLH